ncbi:MAG: gp58-like family protein [Tannerellaceae bacterium]|jgi:hypothetical protein|nr:gp58-like family protein [Tannerellaceae bacterium]
MEIKRGNTVLADVFVKNNSYTNKEINGVNIAYIEFDVLLPVEFTINDYIEYQNEAYYIRYKESIAKEETSLGYNYKITMYHELYRLHDVAFFLYDVPEFKKNTSYYRGNAADVVALVVKSMNRVHQGWTAGTVTETKAMTFDFKDKTCAEVLNDLITTYETEYYVINKSVSIGRLEYPSGGLVLKQGEGFINLSVSAVDDTPPVTRLFAYGSDKNMTAADGDYVQLPGGVKYIEKNISKYGVIEYTKQFEDVYPHGTFTVSEKIDDFTLKASDIDFDINSQLIDEVEVVITFQTGGLAGYDLNIVKGSWKNATRQFKLVQVEEETDIKVPGDIHFAVGDTFIITDIRMPQSYIDAASRELLEAAQKWLDEKCENRVQLSAKCDEIYFAGNMIDIKCGQLVGVWNDKLNIDREIRVTVLKKYIENDGEIPYRYELTLSDFLQGNGLGQIINEVKELPDKITHETQKVKDYGRRTYLQAKEAQEMIEKAVEGFTPGINPVWVRTMSVLIGNEHQQFMFVDRKTEPQGEVVPFFDMNNTTRVFSAPASILKHMTLGIETTSSQYNASNYKYWDVSALASPPLTESSKSYYLVAKCHKTIYTDARFLLQESYTYDPNDGYYYFLVGVLSSEMDGLRSFAPAYGYTEILPGQMRIKMIVSPDGKTYFNVAEGEIGGNIKILSGSTGYNNLSDKPDLSQYVSYSYYEAEFQVLSTQISSKVSQTEFNELGDRVTDAESSITQNARNILLKVSQSDYSGNRIMSLINLDASGATILASKINLIGQVTFSMFNASAQSTINNASSNASTALTNAANAQGTANTALSTANNANTGLSNLSNGLGSLAYQDQLVSLAQLGTTIISGGYIKTELLRTNLILANGAKIGNFEIIGGWLTCNATVGQDVGYIDMRSPNTRIAFGINLNPPSSLPFNSTTTAYIQNHSSSLRSTVALELSAIGRPYDGNISGQPGIALNAKGAVFVKGSFIHTSKYLSISETNFYFYATDVAFNYYSHFVLQPTALQNIYLCGVDGFGDYFQEGEGVSYAGYREFMFICNRWSTSTVRIYGASNCPIIDNNGNTVSYIELQKGDILKLGYYNGSYYKVGHFT